MIEGDLAARRGGVRPRRGRRRSSVRKTRERDEHLGTPDENAPLFAAARRAGREDPAPADRAPLKAVDAIEAATTLPFDEGCRRERELFFECVAERTGEGADPRLLRRARRRQGPRTRRRTPRRRRSRRVAIVGAGTMGGGIAMACANAGLAVTDQGRDAGGARRRHRHHPHELRRHRSSAAGLTADAVGRAAGAHHAAARLRRRARRPIS